MNGSIYRSNAPTQDCEQFPFCSKIRTENERDCERDMRAAIAVNLVSRAFSSSRRRPWGRGCESRELR